MTGCTGYFKKQFNTQMLYLNHEEVSDFYLSSWQSGKSAAPLLILRSILLVVSLVIVVGSLTIWGRQDHLAYWPIYFTNWGLVLQLILAAFATAVSATFYRSGPFVSNEAFSLPWYIKIFWILMNMMVPIAILITVFYWAFLYNASNIRSTEDMVLNVLTHALNSVVMLIFFLSSRLPIRLLHVVHTLILSLTYNVFNIIYFLAGGVDGYGNRWIYPMIDWTSPGTSMLALLFTLILLLILHLFVVALAALRDWMTKVCRLKMVDSY